MSDHVGLGGRRREDEDVDLVLSVLVPVVPVLVPVVGWTQGA